MVLALTTIAEVKKFVEGTSTASDAILTALIGPVSESAEVYLNRHTESKSRVEVYPVDYNAPYIWLRGSPITSVSDITLSLNRTFADIDPLDASTYDVITDTGEIFLRPQAFACIGAKGFMQITYVGGMAADTASFMAAFPRIANAAAMEVVNRFNRAKNPEGNLQFGVSGGVAYQKQLAPLDDFKNALASQRRPVT